MRRYNILVTGVGAIIGYGVIHSLRKSKYDVNIIGMDIYEDAVGQEWCDRFIQAIPAADERYPEFLLECIKSNDVDLVFFGTEQEIKRACDSQSEFGEYYKRLVINKPDIIALSEDKWLTFEFLRKHHIDCIPSSTVPDFELAASAYGLPMLLKPRRSYASKGIKLVSTKMEFEQWRDEHGEQFMVQKYVGDDDHEYTAATFGFGDGTGLQPIIMRRKLSREGSTLKATVVKDSAIEKQIYELVRLLRPIGPTNFQFRTHEGIPLLLEINPRISSSTSIRTAFGYNEAEMCITYFVNGEHPQEPSIQMGRATRYIAERIEYDVGGNI